MVITRLNLDFLAVACLIIAGSGYEVIYISHFHKDSEVLLQVILLYKLLLNSRKLAIVVFCAATFTLC